MIEVLLREYCMEGAKQENSGRTLAPNTCPPPKLRGPKFSRLSDCGTGTIQIPGRSIIDSVHGQDCYSLVLAPSRGLRGSTRYY